MTLETSESIDQIATALAKAQGEVKCAAKDSVNSHFKAKYADLASVWDACREAVSKNGIAVIQSPATADGLVSVTTMLAHSSGQWVRDTVSVAPAKADAQGIGSVVTYLRRYSLAAMVGIAPEDDDGEGAQGRGTNGKQEGADIGGTAPKQTPAAAPKANAAQPQTPKANGNGATFPSHQLIDPDTGEIASFCDKASDFLRALETKMSVSPEMAAHWWGPNSSAALHIANKAPDKAGEFVRKLQKMATPQQEAA